MKITIESEVHHTDGRNDSGRFDNLEASPAEYHRERHYGNGHTSEEPF